jgi:hypothetical protein
MDRDFPYSWGMVPRPSVDSAKPPESSKVVAANLRKLMRAQGNEELSSNPKLGKKTGLGASAISRLVNGHNATLETVDRVAEAFGLAGWQLLIPNLDPTNPPVVQMSAKEADLYRKLKALMKETT